MVAQHNQKNKSRRPQISISITSGEIHLSYKQIGALLIAATSLFGIMQKAQSKDLKNSLPAPAAIVQQAPPAAQIPTPPSIIIINCNSTDVFPKRVTNVRENSSTNSTTCTP